MNKQAGIQTVSKLARGEAAMVAIGQELASALSGVSEAGGLIFLHGTLGAGKTTLCRGLVQSLGHQGAVKSPTYTLVEEYALSAMTVCHFDLYRLGDPEELEYMGIRDYLDGRALCLVEWPEQGAGVLPTADLEVTIEEVEDGQARRLSLSACTDKASTWLKALCDAAADSWQEAP